MRRWRTTEHEKSRDHKPFIFSASFALFIAAATYRDFGLHIMMYATVQRGLNRNTKNRRSGFGDSLTDRRRRFAAGVVGFPSPAASRRMASEFCLDGWVPSAAKPVSTRCLGGLLDG